MINVEMDLLKALCLYVYEEYPVGKKTFPEAYKLLLNKSVEMLDAIFERLPTTHPARGPYQLFQGRKVKEMRYWDLEPVCRLCRINWYSR